ncbi:MAG: hypothetical protein HY360_07125 [Verrucomicrobia bacterium]|nr:hypothetical protein [Verrucomicrobiota bacterium]
MSIMGNVALIREEPANTEMRDGCFRDIDTALKRAIQFSGNLQDVAQNRTVRCGNLDLNGCVRQSLSRLDGTSHALLRVHFDRASTAPRVSADPVLFTCMLLELLSEACCTLSRSMPVGGDAAAFSIHLRSACEGNAPHRNSDDNESRVELKIETRGFHPWSRAEAHADGTTAAGGSGPSRSVEIARIVMKLFRGEVRVQRSGTDGDCVSLVFQPADPPR